MKVISIDQSLTGTALCGLDDGKKFLLETLAHEGLEKGFSRVSSILKKVEETLVEHKPQIFVLEDYSVGYAATGIKLVELGGCIKLLAFTLGYDENRENILRGKNVLMIQSSQSMKKFNLGQGNVTKDTSYLLKVHQRMSIAFDNDNEADAYMHAVMAGLVYKVTRGDVPISNLTDSQQEALISRGVKRQKGLSMPKAMKLSDAKKLELSGF